MARRASRILIVSVILVMTACTASAEPRPQSGRSRDPVAVTDARMVVLQAAAQPDPIGIMIQGMSLDDKIGQLLLLGFSGGEAAGATYAIAELRAGGIVYVANTDSAEHARVLTAELQELARQNGLKPLLIAVDHEGGPVQRIRSGVTVSGANWDVGRINPEAAALVAACQRGMTHGRELAALGINVNLAPVLDVWDNPRNTVIARRAFSDDPGAVARLGRAYIEGIQSEGVLAVAKHFPGHGNTLEDSHFELPFLRRDWDTLHGNELVPFELAIRSGVGGIMTAHIALPLVDSVPDRPATLSPAIITDLLRTGLRYDGLVMTDDLGAMLAITSRYRSGEAAVQAILAGNDLLIISGPAERQRQSYDAIRAAIGESISIERLDTSVRRVLQAKHRLGLIPEAGPWRGLPPTAPSGACPPG